MITILTGPAGAGKNTVAHILAKKRQRCAVIDVDLVRWMVLQPHHAPWSGEEGEEQVALGIKNACMLAKNFQEEGYDVIILDVVGDSSIKIYKLYFKRSECKVIMLLPTLEETQKRNEMRPARLTDERIVALHESQSNFTDYDEKIDNTTLSPEETAEKINQLF